MPAAQGSIVRAHFIRARSLRPLGLMVLAAPLALGACVAENNGMKSASLARKPATASAPSGGPDAYGYAPVRLAALEDGARVALPSAKPDWEKLQATGAAAQPLPSATAAVPAKPAPVKPLFGAKTAAPVAATAPAAAPADEIAALKADVDERRAALVVMTQGKGDRLALQAQAAPVTQTAAAAPAAPEAEAAKTSTLGVAQNLIDPRKSVPAAINVVAHSADAVRVAAVDTTAAAVNGTKRAFDAVQSRIGDTFMSDDSITGSTAIDRMIEQSAAENNIPSELAYAVVRVESHYKPNVVGGGAYGLSQIKPATARGLGYDGPAKGLFDPQTNLRYGMRYLAGAWEKSGHDVCGTAMRYKGGHRTTTMTKAAATYCASLKKHMAAIERRRGPANRETLVAAAERQKHIGEAAGGRKIVDLNARARVLAASVASSAGTARPATASPVAVAATTDAGRAVSVSGVPATRNAAAVVASNAGMPPAKGGRLVRVYSDGAAAAPQPTVFTVSDRLGYAE